MYELLVAVGLSNCFSGVLVSEITMDWVSCPGLATCYFLGPKVDGWSCSGVVAGAPMTLERLERFHWPLTFTIGHITMTKKVNKFQS